MNVKITGNHLSNGSYQKTNCSVKYEVNKEYVVVNKVNKVYVNKDHVVVLVDIHTIPQLYETLSVRISRILIPGTTVCLLESKDSL